MNRNEILKEYAVNLHGVIKTPGKFEGEMLYVPFYWEIFLDGFADRDNGKILSFDVTKEDKLMFPELAKRKTVKLYQRDDGFVGEIR